MLLFVMVARADTLTLREPMLNGKPVKLLQYFKAWEDTTKESDTAGIYLRSFSFQPLNALQRENSRNYYWLSADIQNATQAEQALVLGFTSLTYVDAYLYQNGQCIQHHVTGHFRKKKLITPGDTRLNANFKLEAGETYRLLLKVYHSKGYKPVFNFFLQPREAYLETKHKWEVIDAVSMGAVMVFFVYALLSYLVSCFRPYLWLICFIVGIGFYGICSAGYFINWFFPNNAEIGWLFNTPFAHLGSFGIYMLLLDFWQMKKYNPMLFRFGIVLILEVALITAFGITVNASSGNFNLVNTINLCTFPFPFVFMCASVWTCWKRLTRPQKFLGYGLILFFVAAAYTVLTSALLHEKSLLVAPYLSNFTTLAVFLLFATGLKEELRQHEIVKNAALAALNQMQEQQKSLLEKEVQDRTSELQISNNRLKEQTELLADRNTKIETLINELNHRVKNNLQLLYSLISLQVPGITDTASREMLKGNLGKIKAMMLVNQRLFRFDESTTVNVKDFTYELTDHLQRIYDSKFRIRIVREVEEGIMLHGKITMSFGLILSELLTNTFKYAFTEQENPQITILVHKTETGIRFIYEDNGKGMELKNPGERMTMGVSLIHDLTRQMNGKLQVSSENGLKYEFQIPV